jgi:HPt (histidine-containing phosphotransfer) domain-containing protein
MTLGARASTDSSRSGTPAIDRAVLGEWLDGDDLSIDALLGIFYESICAEAVRMAELLALDELDQFAGAAHRLRGAALSMGARRLGDFVGLLFAAARTKDRDTCVNAMPILATQIQLVEAELPGRAPPAGI